MLPRSSTVGPTLQSTSNSIAHSQTPLAAGPITLTASPFVMPSSPQRVVIGSGSGEGANGTIFTIAGLDWNGNAVSETITATAATSYQSVYDYSQVTSISVNLGTAGAITAGTNGVGSSRPMFLDTFAPGPVALQIDVTGTVNYSVQQTLNDPNKVGYANVDWINSQDSTVVSATASAQSNYGYAPFCCRILVNSGTGSVTFTVQQLDA
jgi:hypothetical protein